MCFFTYYLPAKNGAFAHIAAVTKMKFSKARGINKDEKDHLHFGDYFLGKKKTSDVI